MSELVPTDTDSTDPRLNPMAYLMADAVRLPEDVRKRPLQIAGIGPGYVSLRGSSGAWYRLTFDGGDVTLRYYASDKDYWQPTSHMEPAGITLLNDNGDPIDPETLSVGPPDGSDGADTATTEGTDTVTMQRSGSLAESALSEAGLDVDGIDLPDSWEPVGQTQGAQLTATALVRLLRGEPAQVDVDGRTVTLRPPEGGL